MKSTRTRINLLPWREELRRKRDMALLRGGGGALLLTALALFGIYQYVNGLQENQDRRNSYLQTEIHKLEKQLKEINELKKKRDNLIARMEVIQQLQNDRSEIVHMFDDLVKKLPKGVYLTEFSRKGPKVKVEGVAQSNSRVSSFMQALDSSSWFENPELNVINVTPTDGRRVSQFTLNLAHKSRKKDDSEEDESSGVKAASR